MLYNLPLTNYQTKRPKLRPLSFRDAPVHATFISPIERPLFWYERVLRLALAYGELE